MSILLQCNCRGDCTGKQCCGSAHTHQIRWTRWPYSWVMNDAVVTRDLCEVPNFDCDIKLSFAEWIHFESGFGSVLVVWFIYKAM